MSLLDQLCGQCPREVLRDVDDQALDKQQLVSPPVLRRVHSHLLCLVSVEGEFVVLKRFHESGMSLFVVL